MYIIVISDHAFFRYGMFYMVKHAMQKVLVEAEASDALPNMLSKDLPSLIIMDVRQSGEKMVELCQSLRDSYPIIKIVCCIDTSDVPTTVALLKLDVHGFISLDIGVESLRNSLNQVLSGKYCFNQHVSNIMHQELTRTKDNTEHLPQVQLSRREREILSLIYQQHTSQEISDKLNISKRTVDGYRNRLIKKCRVKNTVGLILFAIKSRLLTNQSETQAGKSIT
ncbi:MAG: DNA-binding response regulator [Cyclobacteriaceae bacterium]